MHERKFVLLPLRIRRLKITVDRLVVFIDVQYSTRRMMSIARILAVHVTVKIEGILMPFEYVVEQFKVTVYHRFAQIAVVKIIYCRQMSDYKHTLFAVGIYLVELILDPYQRFVAVIALVRIKGSIGVYVDTDKINPVYNVMKRAPIKLVRLFL